MTTLFQQRTILTRPYIQTPPMPIYIQSMESTSIVLSIDVLLSLHGSLNHLNSSTAKPSGAMDFFTSYTQIMCSCNVWLHKQAQFFIKQGMCKI